MKKQVVIFRKMIGTGQVVALFPDDLDSCGDCSCRRLITTPELSASESANYQWMIDRSIPATPNDAQDLLKELRLVGYDNVVRQKLNKRKKGTVQ